MTLQLIVYAYFRKRDRPNFRKHKSTRSSGWDHLECQECAELDREVRRKRADFNHECSEEKRREKELELKYAIDRGLEHRSRARASREKYKERRAKAVKPEYVNRGYLSMIIDGAGAQASNYCPRYNTSEKGEPARHNMLKIKSTYVKVT